MLEKHYRSRRWSLTGLGGVSSIVLTNANNGRRASDRRTDPQPLDRSFTQDPVCERKTDALNAVRREKLTVEVAIVRYWGNVEATTQLILNHRLF